MEAEEADGKGKIDQDDLELGLELEGNDYQGNRIGNSVVWI